MEKHKFWDSQPVPKLEDKITKENQPLEIKSIENVSKTSLTLPEGFEWVEIDLDKLDEVRILLCENYVEDSDSKFRLNYSKEFLEWVLKPPGYHNDWNIGVSFANSDKSSQLIAFISAIPTTVCIKGEIVKIVEINFLCIHKDFRKQRLAPILIEEITRRVNLAGIWQAVYTAGIVISKPVGKCQYYHRLINIKKLVNVGFSYIPKRQSLSGLIKANKLPDKIITPGFREAKLDDIPQICNLLKNYLKKTSLYPIFDEEEVAYWFMPRNNIIYCYVVEDKNGNITDIISFHSISTTIVGNITYPTLKIAYSFYNVSTKTSLVELMQNALIIASKLGFDVFNCLDIMDNSTFIEKLKFHAGNGYLHYYIYNWIVSDIPVNKIGLILT